jgi:type II secretion system protein D
VAILTWISPAMPAKAQSPPGQYGPNGPRSGDIFRAYTLRQASAAEAQSQLQQLLSGLPSKTDVVIDTNGNRLLVNGPEQAHQIAQRLIESMDAAPAAPALGAPVVENYSVPADAQPRVLADLRSRFPSHLGVRIAADPPRHQLLIVAPPELHRQIAEHLRSGSRAAPPSAHELARPSAGMLSLSQLTGRAVRIETPWSELHGRLKSVWGDRFVAHNSVSATPGVAQPAVYSVQLNGGETLRLEVDVGVGQITLLGPDAATAKCAKLLAALDRPSKEPGHLSQVVALGNAKPELIERATAAMHGRTRPALGASLRPWAVGEAGRDAEARRADLVTMLFEPRPQAEETADQEEPPPKRKPGEAPPGKEAPGDVSPLTGALIGQVQVDIIPELNLIIITGRDSDVKKILALIDQIVKESEKSAPVVEVYHLQHVQSEAMSEIVTTLYDSVYSARTGTVRITPLVKPNALLLIGQESAVQAAMSLIKRLDEPGPPDAQFQVFRLRHMSAQNAQSLVQQFYGALPGPRIVQQQQQQVLPQQTLPGLFPRLHVIADFRSNALIVRGARRDLNEVARFLLQLDRDIVPAELGLRIFPLRNSLAAELAQVLQAAINAGQQQPGVGQQIPGLQQLQQQIPGQQQQQPGQQLPAGQQQGLERRSTALRLYTLDAKDKRILKSGVLTDVQITADIRANALVVKAPENSMELIEELIRQLDRIPGAEAQVKVFTVVNGDAQALVQMLVALFGQQQGQQGQQQQPVIQLFQPGQPQQQQQVTQGAAQGESALVPIRFAVDTRTNSILATGSPRDLQLVHSILTYLSLSDVRDRQTRVFRLRNVPADQVAQAINQYLQSQRDLAALGLESAFEQLQREVVVVAEVVTNSLIISATPRFYTEIQNIIEDLDRRPPMVMIQVLIAEVALNNTDEFGVELGLQDSVLFDRSLLSDLVTTQTVSQNQTGAQIQQTNVISATALPGFAFNNQPLGNNAFANTSRLGGQALSHFSVGRINGELGYGGLVLAASNESISILIRALQECRRLDVLSRPQITTLNNQPAFVQVGQRVQLIQSSTIDPTTNIQTNQLGPAQNIGLILGVTPRVSLDDGNVAMEIDVEKSELGPEAEGIPISVSPATGDVIRSPFINTTTAQTTVSALSGQTIVLGGLITSSKLTQHRRVPLLASIPVLGHLFRYDLESQRKTELLIILTPHVIWDAEDAELLKQVESARISWVLSDVHRIHGLDGLRSRWDGLDDRGIPTIRPDSDPCGVHVEGVPTPVHEHAVEVLPPLPPKANGQIKPGGPAPGAKMPPMGPPGTVPPGSARPPWLEPPIKPAPPPPTKRPAAAAVEGPMIPQPSAAMPRPQVNGPFPPGAPTNLCPHYPIQPAGYQEPTPYSHSLQMNPIQLPPPNNARPWADANQNPAR